MSSTSTNPVQNKVVQAALDNNVNSIAEYINGVFGRFTLSTQTVTAATTANITLKALQTIDGVSLAVNNVVLVKNQTEAKNNGLYAVSTTNWERLSGFTTESALKEKIFKISNGTTNKNKLFYITNKTFTVGTDAIEIAEYKRLVSEQLADSLNINDTLNAKTVTVDGTVKASTGNITTINATNATMSGTTKTATLNVTGDATVSGVLNATANNSLCLKSVAHFQEPYKYDATNGIRYAIYKLAPLQSYNFQTLLIECFSDINYCATGRYLLSFQHISDYNYCVTLFCLGQVKDTPLYVALGKDGNLYIQSNVVWTSCVKFKSLDTSYCMPSLIGYARYGSNVQITADGGATLYESLGHIENQGTIKGELNLSSATTGSINSYTGSTYTTALTATGATTLNSTLGVTGATTLNSTLGVTGNATFSGGCTVTGGLSVTGTLNATLAWDKISNKPAYITGSLDSTGTTLTITLN